MLAAVSDVLVVHRRTGLAVRGDGGYCTRSVLRLKHGAPQDSRTGWGSRGAGGRGALILRTVVGRRAYQMDGQQAEYS